MAPGAITHRDLPLPLKWQRQDETGHDASVVVGLMDTLTVDEKAGEVWGEGELFDDAGLDLPRLAEDVAEAKHLTAKGVIGPSVDAGAAEVMLVVAGTDEEPTDEQWDQIMMGAEGAPEIEMLFTAYEIAAATLVPIPAFGECRPFELRDPADADSGAEDEADATAAVVASAAVVSADRAAAVAALTAAAPAMPAAWFDDPALDGPTPITVDDDGRIRGHVAAWSTCHAEFRDVCVAAPRSVTGYAHFHRHTVNADTGVLAAGRLTTGHGRMGTGCACCRGKDDHACTRAGLTAATAHYDQMRTLAWVRAGEDEHGIWLAGALATDLDERDRAVLARRLVSGDWREVGGHLELVEVLALASERPGFPLPRTSLAAGRQRSLVAAGAVRPDPARGVSPRLDLDYRLLGREVVAALRASEQAAVLAALPVPEPTPPPEPEPVDVRVEQAVALAAEVEQAAAEDRARQAAALAGELAAVA
jgi:hypothetical protein